jgi:hypothetical protein
MLAKHVDLKKRLSSKGTKTGGRRTLAKHVGLMFTLAIQRNKDIREKHI